MLIKVTYAVCSTVAAVMMNEAVAWEKNIPTGNPTLTLLVTCGSQRLAAERAVSGSTGVQNVKDDIEILYDADPVDVSLLVNDAIDRNALFYDDSHVLVDTTGNTVTLSGHVRIWAEHDAAVGAAWMASGVYAVIDEITVTG